MLVRCTEHQDLVGEKDERGKALSANVVKSAGKLPYFPSYPSDINRTTYIAGWQAHHHRVPAILQYRPSDLYLTDRKETMAILQKDTRTPLHICK